jgi:hypothetical protein
MTIVQNGPGFDAESAANISAAVVAIVTTEVGGKVPAHCECRPSRLMGTITAMPHDCPNVRMQS